MTSFARRERLALSDTALRFGPDAPTLCDPWDTRMLVCHLLVRERHPVAATGITVGALDAVTRHTMERLAHEDFARLVQRFRSPGLVPFGWPGVEQVFNTLEHFIHHEDIRRANGDGPRHPVDPDLADALWWRLRAFAMAMFRRVHGVGVELRRVDGATVRAKRGEPSVTITGEVPELFLYGFNRKSASAVGLVGPEDAVARIREAPLGP